MKRFILWFRHYRSCVPFIEEGGEVINGMWWGWCSVCGCRYAKDVHEGRPLDPWMLM